jgi:hypothetical protein
MDRANREYSGARMILSEYDATAKYINWADSH